MGNEAPIHHTANENQTNDTDQKQTELQLNEAELSSLLELLSEMQKIRMNKEAETMTSNKINMKTDFKVFVGIDFGTNGCGIAYAINHDLLPNTNGDSSDDSSDDTSDDDNKDDKKNNEREQPRSLPISDGYTIIPHQWNDLSHDNSKLNTCILLNAENELQMVGNYARITFTEMQKNNWKLFDNFKMSLYKQDDDEGEEGQDNERKEEGKDDEKDDNDTKKYIHLKHQVKSYDGSITEADIVFCATLKFLKEEALKYIAERIGIKDIGIDDIQWVLTIPALWNNESRAIMRQWGLASGLVNKDITNHLKIVLEPECASLQIQHEYQHHKNIQFNKNDKYILVDAGGGTVDIVAHEIYSDFGVKEIIASFGGPYGSINIDHKFNALFDILFKKENMDIFKKNRPKEYVKWLEEVVASKRSFYDNGEENMYHSVQLDMTFYNEIKKQTFENKKLKKYIKSIEQVFGVNASDIDIGINGKESMFTISKSGIDYVYLNIHKNLWKTIFDDNCLNDIINKIKNIMTENNILNDLKYIFMVGGLSQSKYFQKRMRDEFKSISIVIPQNPLLSVVCGAARYGYKTDFVHTRILKQTYAIRITATYQTLMIDHQMRDLVEYIDNNNSDKDEENEALINHLIELYKNDVNQDDFKSDVSDSELRKLLCNNVLKPQLDEVPISKEWIENNITYSPMAKKLVCNRLLSVLAKKGDQIEINCKDKITRTYQRFSKDQKISSIEIYSSNHRYPRIIDEATKICEGQLIYPNMDDNDDDALDVILEISFDDSLLIAYVYPKGKPDQRAEVVLEYQTN